MKQVAFVVVAFAILAVFVWAIVVGTASSERAECEKWKAQAFQYIGFYITEWQEMQCNSYGIEIDAPVAKP